MEAHVAASAPVKIEKRRADAQADNHSRNDRGPKENRDAERSRDRAVKQRKQIEEAIGKSETERAKLAEEMNRPDFYLARKDADELIARYESLGREVEKLYADLVKFEEPGKGL